jgi:uncharacterized protein (TIGR00297 family)
MVEIIFYISIGLVGSVLIAWLGYRRASLSMSGAIGTVLIGTTVFGVGGAGWWMLLIGFFVSSSLLSHFRSAQKSTLVDKFSKGARRDIWQVLANGGIAALLSVVYAIESWPWIGIVFAGSLAAVNADTWATELGVLNSSRPRLVTTGRPVEPGTNGAVSAIGTVAALAGAFFIAVLAIVLTPLPVSFPSPLSLFLAISVGGFSGSLVDSVFGATAQKVYFCDYCRRETEQAVHACGRATRLVRGWRWLNNDGVNFLCAGTGGLVALLSWILLH